jgi:epoxyqueuosine reductase
MGKRLKKLRARLRERGIQSWGGVDTAPVVERAWSGVAGLGFIGKNNMAIWPGRTSWMFLAVLFVDVALRPDLPLPDHCGSCRRCLDVCPTDAFVGPRQLDATRCIAYWTIEAKGLAPRALRSGFGRWVFGCDLCQEVCPHNHHPPDSDEQDLAPRHPWLDLDDLLQTPDAVLMARYIGTPLRRPGAAGLKRNAAIALANLADDGAVDVLRSHGLVHPAPVVRGAAIWALQRLGVRLSGLTDPDPLVRAELAPLD